MDIAVRIEREGVVLRCTVLDEPGHPDSPFLSLARLGKWAGEARAGCSWKPGCETAPTAPRMAYSVYAERAA